MLIVGGVIMDIVRRIALVLAIIGAINWGLIGLFQYDLVASIFGGQDAGLSRIIYTLVGISGLFLIGTLFEPIGDNRRLQRNPEFGTEFGEETDFDKND